MGIISSGDAGITIDTGREIGQSAGKSITARRRTDTKKAVYEAFVKIFNRELLFCAAGVT
jgi:hypothetical protein